MDNQPVSAAVEIVANDLRRSLDFYRLLGLTIPADDAGHVEVDLPGGSRLLFDTEETIAGLHPGWTAPTSPGRVTLAFGLAAPRFAAASPARSRRPRRSAAADSLPSNRFPQPPSAPWRRCPVVG